MDINFCQNPGLTDDEENRCEEIFNDLRSFLHQGLVYNEMEQNVGMSIQQIVRPGGKEALMFISSEHFALEIMLFMVYQFEALMRDQAYGLLVLESIKQNIFGQKENTDEEEQETV